MSNILKATHEGELHICKVVLSVAVLEDGTRIINQSDILRRLADQKEDREMLVIKRMQSCLV